jgi:hypothetical protein
MTTVVSRIAIALCLIVGAFVFVRITSVSRGFACTARASFFAQKPENFAVLIVPREEAKQLILLRVGLLLSIRSELETPCTIENVSLLAEGDDQVWRRLDYVPVEEGRRVYLGSYLHELALVDLGGPTLEEATRSRTLGPGETIQAWGLFAGRDYRGRGRLKVELRCDDGQTYECPIIVTQQPDSFSIQAGGIKILEKALDRTSYQLVL